MNEKSKSWEERPLVAEDFEQAAVRKEATDLSKRICLVLIKKYLGSEVAERYAALKDEEYETEDTIKVTSDDLKKEALRKNLVTIRRETHEMEFRALRKAEEEYYKEQYWKAESE